MCHLISVKMCVRTALKDASDLSHTHSSTHFPWGEDIVTQSSFPDLLYGLLGVWRIPQAPWHANEWQVLTVFQEPDSLPLADKSRSEQDCTGWTTFQGSLTWQKWHRFYTISFFGLFSALVRSSKTSGCFSSVFMFRVCFALPYVQ